MQPYSVERSIIEGELEVKEFFEYVQNSAAEFETYEIEKAVFARLMRIDLPGMKCYFAEKGTGDVWVELQLEDGKVLKKKSRAEALAEERMGRVLSREIPIFQGADVVGRYGRQYRMYRNREIHSDPARSETLSTYGSIFRGNREIPYLSLKFFKDRTGKSKDIIQ